MLVQVLVQAQAPAAPPQLTALDYIEIQQLVSKYARAIDTCSNNGYDYADLFTADGYFAPEQNGKIGNKAQGRERLAEISGGGSRGCKNVGWIRQGVKHLYVNHIITPTAEGATGTVDMLMIGLGGDPYKIHHEGYYEDTYVKTPQGWRFKSRVITCLRVARQGSPRRLSSASASVFGLRDPQAVILLDVISNLLRLVSNLIPPPGAIREVASRGLQCGTGARF